MSVAFVRFFTNAEAQTAVNVGFIQTFLKCMTMEAWEGGFSKGGGDIQRINRMRAEQEACWEKGDRQEDAAMWEFRWHVVGQKLQKKRGREQERIRHW